MTIGEKIRQVRKGLGLTQEQLAKKCGVATITIRQYETGKREPRYEQIRIIARAMNIPENAFFSAEWYNYSEEYLKLEKSVKLFEGIICALEEIYGVVKAKEVKHESGLCQLYWVVGHAPNTFVLYDTDIKAISKSVQSSLPALVEHMGDKRNEGEIVKEMLTEMDDFVRQGGLAHALKEKNVSESQQKGTEGKE